MTLAPAILLLAPALAIAAPRDSVTLTGTWRLQPAESPAVPPVDDQWADVTIDAWNYPGGNGAIVGGWNGFWYFRLPDDGPAWCKGLNAPRKRGDIHRLWWSHRLDVPADWQGRRILLEFERFDGDAVVFLNGQRLQELLQPSGTIDITKQVKVGQPNTLWVYLTRDYTGISRTFEQDVLRYTTRGPQGRRAPMDQWPFGITGPVYLRSRPLQAAITNTFVQTSWREKRFDVDVEVDAAEPLDGQMLQAVIQDQDGRPVLTFEQPLGHVEPGVSTHRLSRAWPEPRLWELEAPYLYTLTVSLKRDDQTLDSPDPIRFGFRELWTERQMIMLNGHPVQFRLGWTANLSRNTFGLLRMVGLNVFEFQPNPTCWYDVWPSGWPLVDEDKLDLLDESGCGALLLAPTVTHFRDKLLTDPAVEVAHHDMLQRWIRKYRNHPSIFAWLPSMNYVGNHANIHADGMGQAEKVVGSTNEQVLSKSLDMIKAIDPTRLAFGHADGNIGDISSSNVYLNWVPLQEREEWPSEYAKTGDLPYMAVEFGQPFTMNYWKEPNGPRFLLTEYLAMYFGDRAYTTEGEQGLADVVGIGLGKEKWSKRWASIDTTQFPTFWDMQKLFISHTDRAWRTWGVAGGWFYWDFDVGYGKAPEGEPSAPITSRPDWVNPNFDIHRATMQPLLVYLGGAPQHTDKTHAYYAGESIQKQIVWIWDGPGKRTLDAKWSLVDAAGKPVDGATVTKSLLPGAVNMTGLECAAPQVDGRADYTLQLAVTEHGQPVAEDRFPLQVFPQPKPTAGTVALLDPAGKSEPWLKSIGLGTIPWERRADADVWVLGRQALDGLHELPFTTDDIRAGKRVLILEQMPESWEAMGLKSIETMPRYTFASAPDHPVLDGLQPADLINWRGSPDLLPEKQWHRSYDFYHAPKWTNSHAVASTALELPEMGGFTPLIECEFDLNYSPLLQFRCGQGEVIYSSLDFTGRVGEDPAATRLASNLLAWLAKPDAAQDKRLARIGDEAFGDQLAALGFDATALTADEHPGVVAVSPGDWTWLQLEAMALAGRTVIVWPQPADKLKAGGYATTEGVVHHTTPVDEPLFAGVGPRLLRWRDGLKGAIFVAEGQPDGSVVLGDGLFLHRELGTGRLLLIQADADELAGRYADDEAHQKAVWPSVERLQQMYAAILTAAGARPSEALVARLGDLRSGAKYETLATWQVCGPYLYPELATEEVIKQVAEPEPDAIAGHAAPDIRYYRPDGKELNWRDTVTAGPDGFVNLGEALGADLHALAYVTRQVVSPTTRTARLRVGVDFFLQAWVNGELVYDLSAGNGTSPKPACHAVDVKLNEGVNIVTLKVAAGSKGFGFWADLSGEGFDFAKAESEPPPLDLYPKADRTWDPYHFHYY